MKKKVLFGIITLIFLLVFTSNSFAQKPCNNDRDCKSLNHIEKLENPKCYDNIYVFAGQEKVFSPWTTSKKHSGAHFWYPSELLGKRYTFYLQTSYEVQYKCGKNGYCEVATIDPYAEGCYEECTYGCLLTPTYYKKEGEEEGKFYSNFCLCNIARVGDSFCDPSIGNDIYYRLRNWTCEEEVQKGMECGTGGNCGVRDGTIGCWPLEGDDAKNFMSNQSASSSVQYTLGMTSMTQPIMVIALQNGQIIAEKPISNLSAEQYIARYGPVKASQAYAFAQKLGLTAYASRNNSFETGTTTASTRTSSYIARANYSINNSISPVTLTKTTSNYYKPSYSNSPYSKTYYRKTYYYTPKTTISRIPSTRTRKTYTYKTPITRSARYFTRKTYTPTTTRYYSRNTYTPRTTKTPTYTRYTKPKITRTTYYTKRYTKPTRTTTRKTSTTTKTAKYTRYGRIV